VSRDDVLWGIAREKEFTRISHPKKEKNTITIGRWGEKTGMTVASDE